MTMDPSLTARLVSALSTIRVAQQSGRPVMKVNPETFAMLAEAVGGEDRLRAMFAGDLPFPPLDDEDR